MEELALVPAGAAEATIVEHTELPIAEHNFARKKLLELDRGIEQLRREARQQHEIVSQLGDDVKTSVSELDLRRAVGLTMQEIEARLEDVFQDSNRKCLVMFAKREEVAELQANITKKVNWTEYHSVLKKLAEQRQYIETMAESVFGGRRDGLSAEFAKKADASAVEEALKAKAGISDVNEVRARLERLEVLVHNSTSRHSEQLEEIRNLAAREAERESEKLQGFIQKNSDTLSILQENNASLAGRLQSVESVVGALEETRSKIAEEQLESKNREEGILQQLSELIEKVGRVDQVTKLNRGDLQGLGVEVHEIRNDTEQKMTGVTQLVDTCKSRLDFLMQANEMMKRKAKEVSKSTTTKFGQVEEEQEKLASQLAAMEKSVKKWEREFRAVEQRQLRDITSGGVTTSSINALMAPAQPIEDQNNDRLKGILDQLEKISASGHPFEHMGADVDPKRPPLPWAGDRQTRGMADGTLSLPKYAGYSGPAPIDSARSVPLVSALAGATQASVRVASSSPRGVHAPGGKTPRKKRVG